MAEYIWLAPAFPLAGMLINGFFGRRLPRSVSGTLACAVVLLSFAVSLAALVQMRGAEAGHVVRLFSWIPAGEFRVNFSFLVDPLSLLMITMVTFIGFWIHVYSVSYMSHDEGFARYFAYLNLFTFSMLLLVLADNFLLLYVGWELVGLCSYLLIGFWYRRPGPANAAKKAFIVNRVGDFGFALGIMLIFATFGTLDFLSVFREAPGVFRIGAPVVTAITLLLFIGAAGKSAQIPLHVWLPDAMEGPTPVSALIHAATMVTAGVYMVARSHVLYELAPVSMAVVASVGALTALMAASIGLVMNDLKRVLAYSTISQLGYMFLAAGVGAFGAGVFHLMTHAFFKALMFLGAGSVMHAASGEIDMRNLGGLGRTMKITAWTFLAGVLAISGVPLFSGFFSKDEILVRTFSAHMQPSWLPRILWAAGFLTAFLTALYMGRAFFKTFYGESRLDPQKAAHLHESPRAMTWPLVILAFGSVLAGYVGVPRIFGGNNLIEAFLEPAVGGHSAAVEASLEWTLTALSAGAGLLGLGLAVLLYLRREGASQRIASRVPGLYRLLLNKYYVDEAYEFVFVRGGKALADSLWRVMDVRIIDAAVNGAAGAVNLWSETLRLLQTGRIRQYALSLLAALILLAAWIVYG